MPEIGTIIFAQYFSDIWPVHQEQFEALVMDTTYLTTP